MGKWRKKDGILAGLVLGTVALVLVTLTADFPFKQQVSNFSLIAISVVGITAFAVAGISAYKGKSAVTPGFDGFVYGFAMVFSGVSLIISIQNGTLPLSV